MIEPYWLPSLPPAWHVRGLGYCCDIGTGELDTIDATDDGTVPLYIRSPRRLRASRATHNGEAVLTPGDGAVGEVFHHHQHGPFAVHQRVYVLSNFASDVWGRYFYWYFSETFRWVTSQGTAKSTVESLRRPMFTSFPVSVPPLDEQRVIADYLDRETAEIDLLIEKQTTLIDRLRERRRAVISSMVVGGSSTVGSSQERPVALDQQLSALPSGWGRVRLSRLATSPVTAGVDFSAAMLSEGHIRYVRTTDIATLSSLTSADKAVGITYEMAGTSLVQRDDLLFTRSGSLGTSYLHQSDEVMAYAGYLVRLRPDTGRCLPGFLGWWSQSDDHLDQIAVGATRSTIDNFSASKFSAMRVPLPPLEEQRRIVDHIDRETAKIDELIAKTERFIELAKERRSALITAAVTGQIDVTSKGAA